MINHVPHQELGSANYGWLKSKHHFSFANYFNPNRSGFGALRVINDDWVAAGKGFPPHPHRNMEIISFIRTGEITHQDSTGNKGVTKAGEVQVMSAGTGIVHSEYNLSAKPLTFYQIWIETNKKNVKPRWETQQFATTVTTDLQLLVSGYSEDQGQALFINQKARIYGAKLAKGTIIEQTIEHQAYLLASEGMFSIKDESGTLTVRKGDGAEISNTTSIILTALTEGEVLLIDVPS